MPAQRPRRTAEGNAALPAESSRETELRCECGCLIAKVVRLGIELKCRRCKRTGLLPMEKLKEGTAGLLIRMTRH